MFTHGSDDGKAGAERVGDGGVGNGASPKCARNDRRHWSGRRGNHEKRVTTDGRGSLELVHRLRTDRLAGGPIEEIRAGDIVWVAPGERHRHGASPTTAMTHIAIAEMLDGKAVEWMEHVSDEQYRG